MRSLALLTGLLLSTTAYGQTVQQQGSIVPGHAVKWTGTGRIGDAGPFSPLRQSGVVTAGHGVKWIADGIIGDAGNAAAGSFTSLGVTNNGGPGICLRSSDTDNYQRVCLVAQQDGPSQLVTDHFGTQTAQSFEFVINGTTVALPTSGGGSAVFPTIMTPQIDSNRICADGTGGALKGCDLVVGASFFGNATADPAISTNFAIVDLPAIASVDPNNDLLVILDISTGLLKSVNPGQIASSATSGVSSLGGATGALTLASPFTIPAGVLTLGTVVVAKGGTNCTSASGTCLDNITGFSSTGYIKRASAGTYTFAATVPVADISGTLPVANGGTNCAVASGTCVDNISGFATTGYLKRTGAGTYTLSSTIPGTDMSTTVPVPVAAGGTGLSPGSRGLLLYAQGMQPLKLDTALSSTGVIGINAGSFADSSGARIYSVVGTQATLSGAIGADLASSTILPTGQGSDCYGAMVSGAMNPVGSTTDGTQVNLYMVKRASDDKLCLVASSSYLAAADLQVLFEGGGSERVFTIDSMAALTPSDLLTNTSIYCEFANKPAQTCPGLPTVGPWYPPGSRYYAITTSHLSSTVRVATAINGSPLTFATAGDNVRCIYTMKQGVINDLSFSQYPLAPGSYTFLRGLRFGFVWNFTLWGGIPDFTAVPPGNDNTVWLTGPSSAFNFLSSASGSGTATGGTWLNNANRLFTFRVECTASGSVGFGLINNMTVCEGIPGQFSYAMFTTYTQSDGEITWQTTGGATMSARILGWNWTNPL